MISGIMDLLLDAIDASNAPARQLRSRQVQQVNSLKASLKRQKVQMSRRERLTRIQMNTSNDVALRHDDMFVLDGDKKEERIKGQGKWQTLLPQAMVRLGFQILLVLDNNWAASSSAATVMRSRSRCWFRACAWRLRSMALTRSWRAMIRTIWCFLS